MNAYSGSGESKSFIRKSAVFTVAIAFVAFVGVASARAHECGSNATFSGPIIITVGGTYQGNWKSNDPGVPAVSVFTTQPVTIVNSRAIGAGDLVNIGSKANVTIRESCFVGVYPAAGKTRGNAIHAYQVASLTVDHCDFVSVGGLGIFVQGYLGDSTPDNSVKIRYNRFENLDARVSDGNGGYIRTESSQWSHGIMLVDVQRVPEMEIAWNQIVNEPYNSGVGDSISVFDSSGTLSSPIQVHDNYIQGGWDTDLKQLDDPPYYGSAFTTDGFFQTDPDLTTAFLKVHHNQAVSFGNSGIGIAIGHDIELYANRVVSSGQLADGTPSTTSYALGIQHLNWQNNPAGVFGNNSIHDNLVGVRKWRNGRWERSDYAFFVEPSVNRNNDKVAGLESAPTVKDEAVELVRWQEKLLLSDVVVGSQLVAPPVGGAVQIVSGDNQVGRANATLPSPLVIRVLTSRGSPVAGVSVAFTVTRGNATTTEHFSVTDARGTATARVTLADRPTSAVTIDVIAPNYSGATFHLAIAPDE
jgi:hypothetical protein